MSLSEGPLPTPGWYEDETGAMRWWTGSEWAPVYQPVVALQPPRKRVNHILHAILSIFTGGMWIIVWVALVLRARNV